MACINDINLCIESHALYYFVVNPFAFKQRSQCIYIGLSPSLCPALHLWVSSYMSHSHQGHFPPLSEPFVLYVPGACLPSPIPEDETCLWIHVLLGGAVPQTSEARLSSGVSSKICSRRSLRGFAMRRYPVDVRWRKSNICCGLMVPSEWTKSPLTSRN